METWKSSQEKTHFTYPMSWPDKLVSLSLLEHSDFTRIWFLISLMKKKENCFSEPLVSLSSIPFLLMNWIEVISSFCGCCPIGGKQCHDGESLNMSVSKLLMSSFSVVFSVSAKGNFMLTSASPSCLYSKSVLQRDPSDQMGLQYSPSSFYALFFSIVPLSIWHIYFIHWSYLIRGC